MSIYYISKRSYHRISCCITPVYFHNNISLISFDYLSSLITNIHFQNVIICSRIPQSFDNYYKILRNNIYNHCQDRCNRTQAFSGHYHNTFSPLWLITLHSLICSAEPSS